MEGDFLENWVIQLRKGLLELCLLNSIKGGKFYGYDLVKRLSRTDGLVINEGTAYPILSRFKKEGLVTASLEESSEGPARKYYRLTARGAQYLTQMNAHWHSVCEAIDALKQETGK